MKKTENYFLVVLVVFLFSLSLTAQKAKSSSVYSYTYSIPNWYFPKNYTSYTSKINLPTTPIKAFVNGEYHSDKSEITFNAFFEEKKYTNLFSTINGLTRTKTPTESTVTIFANIINPRIDITITKGKNPVLNSKGEKFETPHTYEITFGYEIEFKVDNFKGETIFTQKIGDNEKYNFPIGKKRQTIFNKEEDAITYTTNYIDKSLITTEMYKNIMKDLGANCSFKRSVQFKANNNSFFYFYRVSRAKKNVNIAPFNEFVASFKEKAKVLNKKQNTKNKKTNNQNFKKELEFSKNSNSTKEQSNYAYKISPELSNLVLSFEKEMIGIFSRLDDTSHKSQKALAWSSLINCANAFYMIGDFKKSLEYYNKAATIDYKEDYTTSFKNKMLKKKKKLELFYENNEIKPNVHPIYMQYLKSFDL